MAACYNATVLEYLKARKFPRRIQQALQWNSTTSPIQAWSSFVYHHESDLPLWFALTRCCASSDDMQGQAPKSVLLSSFFLENDAEIVLEDAGFRGWDGLWDLSATSQPLGSLLTYQLCEQGAQLNS